MPRRLFHAKAKTSSTLLFVITSLITLSLVSVTHGALTQELPPFTEPGHAGWQEKRFAGQTVYTPVLENGLKMLHASSQGSASGLVREQTIDLRRTPVLNWSWKVEKIMPGIDERQKKGDDFAARVYVVAKGGLAFWNTRALSYVWSNSQPVGTLWPNPFTANAILIAAQSGKQHLGLVMDEKHNVREDWRQAFGEDISTIDAIAIMTDADNSGLSSSALYSTPWFSSD